ncbi:MAG TPA: FGGY-family carbohydrate kinase [Chroococcidiopsis sp.]
MTAALTLGIDFGTSGARAIAIDASGTIQAQGRVPFGEASSGLAALWQTALFEVIAQLPLSVRQALGAIAINGTSSTVLICDDQGRALDEPILYHDDRGESCLGLVRAIAPANHTVISATSSLAKLLWWSMQRVMVTGETEAARADHDPDLPPIYFLHQADWLAFALHGQLGISDYHNALKLGYDVGALRYPNWMAQVPSRFVLPQVLAPGQVIGPITEAIATRFSIPANCVVCAGTTDSIAAFLASGAHTPGDAVTSLGSTLVLKLLSQTRIDDPHYGIYSHRLGDLWLVGGASNTGGAVLRQFFSDDDLERLSDRIPRDRDSPLDYYPLLRPGERFPINDPSLEPRLEPRPDDPVAFLHGLLAGISRIEAEGYRLLRQRGATALRQVYTAGGGAQNQVWMEMRSRYLGVPVVRSAHTEAAYGSALLARQGWAKKRSPLLCQTELLD